MSNQLKYEKDAAGIVTITIDMDGPVNKMNEHFGTEFGTVVDRLEKEDDLAGVVLASAKKTFFAGGDLEWLLAVEPGSEATLFENVEAMKAVMRRVEKLPVPVVAAINGAALGGGYELCLMCNHRIALDDKSVKIGLPEVTLGLLPGGGGVVRLTWLLGLQAAMPYLTEGKQVVPSAAKSAGLIHETVDSLDELIPRAKAWIEENRGTEEAHTQPWDTKGYRIPGGGANSPKIAPLIAAGSAMLFAKTQGRLPAPERILDTMVDAARLDFDTALRVESRNFAYVVTTPVAKNMIRSFFFQLNQVNGGGSRPQNVNRSSVKKVGIIGAGMMGQGIAFVSARAGIEVVLKDVELAGAERGKAYSEKLLDKRVGRGRMSQAERDEVLARITPTAESGDLEGCDLIIEAVFENVELKDQILTENEGALVDNGIWGSNTSTLPITRLATKSRRAENFIGLHFFSPVDKMPLLEIVVGKKTSDETLARAFDYARQIKKTPIVVKDALGFYTSRTIGTHLMEAAQMVAEGVEPVRVEALSKGLGYPVGSLTLLDEVSLSLSVDIHDTQVRMGLRKDEDDVTPEATALLRTMVKELNRPGKKEKKGFFDYEGEKRLWPGLSRWRKEDGSTTNRDIEDRLMFRPILESFRCLEEGILLNVPDGNIGSVMGIGAPPWTGGYLQFVNTYGVQRFVDRCDELAQTYGKRFAPPEILQKHAKTGALFV